MSTRWTTCANSFRRLLCEKENLLVDQFAMTEFPLIRGGELCGLHFSLRGPRNVRLGAIWAADQNVVYLYDARGASVTPSCSSRVGWQRANTCARHSA
jgi:hypothetical protein